MKNFNFKLAFFIFFLALFQTNLYSQEKKSDYERFWVQYSENNSILFRFLTNFEKKCPIIKFDNSQFQTIERNHIYKEEFPIKICQAVFQNDQQDHQIQFKNHQIQIHGYLEKISTIGDTGCVVKKNKLTGKVFEQDCLDPMKYPFEINTKQMKKGKPNLIIHVGDYYYTEKKCEDESKCGGRPYGDNLSTWRVDFLDAAKNLFETSPMIFARGNHEKCDKGGKGWTVLFDNSIDFKECSNYDDAFKIKFQNIEFFMIDSSDSSDLVEIKSLEDRKKVEFYSSEFQKILNDINSKKINVILTHRPVFALEFEHWKKECKKSNEINLILKNALLSVSKNKLKHIDFVLSGHIHMGAALKIKNSKKNLDITQIISGNGGININTAKHYNNEKFIFEKENRVLFYKQSEDFGFLNILLDSKKNYNFQFMNLKQNKLN